MASRLVMGQELHAAIADATRDAPYVARRDLYDRYFHNADWRGSTASSPCSLQKAWWTGGQILKSRGNDCWA